MITRGDIISYRLPDWQLRICKANAKKAELGGQSHIHDNDTRAERLSIDQLMGQIGELIGTRHLTGSVKPYLCRRQMANRVPENGDGGTDLLGTDLDFKASRRRDPKNDLLDYHLLVVPAERDPRKIYVLIIVDYDDDNDTTTAHILGWAADDMLPEEIDKEFDKAYALPARELNPVMPLQWFK